jgi:hypothetical protein
MPNVSAPASTGVTEINPRRTCDAAAHAVAIRVRFWHNEEKRGELRSAFLQREPGA